MATRSYIGRPDAGTPSLLHLRLVNSDTDPDYLVPTIVAIHHLTFRGDTAATTAALLRCVWAYLGVDVTAADTFMPGDIPIAGVGMAIDAAPAGPPVAVHADRIGDLPAQWVYLLDPAAGTLTVLATADPAHPVAVYTLTGPPHAEDQR